MFVMTTVKLFVTFVTTHCVENMKFAGQPLKLHLAIAL